MCIRDSRPATAGPRPPRPAAQRLHAVGEINEISRARCAERQLDVLDLEDLERHARLDQAVCQALAHRGRGGHLTRGLGVVVEDQTESGLCEHLGRLAVAGVTPGDLGHDAACASLADETHREPRLLATLLTRALPLRDPSQDCLLYTHLTL